MFRSWQMLLTAEMFAAFVLIGLIGLALTRGLRALQQRALAWHRRKGSSHERCRRAIAVASLVVLAAAPAASAQAKPTVKIGYIPTDSFAALFLLADRHLPAAGVNVETVRLAGGPEIVSQVATGQLQLGGAGMGAAGFNAVVSGLPVEYVAPLHSGYVEDYFVVRKALWGKEVKRIADLKGRTVALNIRGAAVEWMLDLALRRDGLTIKDVQVKLMPFPDMVPALESGAVDAAILSEPFPTLAEEKGVAVRPLTKAPGAKPVPITAIFWNKEWATANPELAHARDGRLSEGRARSRRWATAGRATGRST